MKSTQTKQWLVLMHGLMTSLGINILVYAITLVKVFHPSFHSFTWLIIVILKK